MPQREASKNHSAIVEKIRNDAEAKSLEADEVIEELFEVANIIPLTDELINMALTRMDVGRPPGKKGSIGDAINWLALINAVPAGADLHFIADDSDFFSPLDKEELHPYLREEWADAKQSEIVAYRRLSSFFGEHYAEIELASELEKDILIQEFATSENFLQTHKTVLKLRKFSEFTPSQRIDIVQAAITNNQIYWIATDSDINTFVKSIVSGFEELFDQETLDRVEYFLNELKEYGEFPYEHSLDFVGRKSND